MKTLLFSVIQMASAILLLIGSAYGQESVLSSSVGARNASMANANISESSDASVMYENPAALAYLDNGSILLNHSQANSSSGMRENLTVPVVLRSPVSIALGLDAYHFGYFRNPAPSDQRFFEYGYDLAFAGDVTPTLSVGGSASLRHGTAGDGTQAWGSYFALGADYAPTPDISYSFVWGGLGRDVTFFPDAMGIGMTTASRPTSTFVEIGATMTFPSKASLRPPFFIMSLANEKIAGITGLYYMGGIEIRPLQFLELRVGYLSGPGVSAARYGLGIKEGFFGLQYAVYPEMGTKTLIQQFSISMAM